MIKEITYNGITYSPSDYECSDGDLACISGLINEDGSMKPMVPPKTMFEVNGSDRVLYLHKNSDYRHYIAVNGDGMMSWYDEQGHRTEIGLSGLNTFTFSSIGNILVASDSLNARILYILWKDQGYTILGDHLPELRIRFTTSQWFNENGIPVNDDADMPARASMLAMYGNEVGFGSDLVDSFPSDSNNVTSVKNERLDDASNIVMGEINKATAESSKLGLFTYPHLIRFAYRMFDGEYVQYSAPVLVWNQGMSGTAYGYNEKARVISHPYYVDYYIENPEELSAWGDIIKGVTFFASQPIYDIDTNGKVYRMKHQEGGAFRFELPEISAPDQRKALENTHTFYRIYDIDASEYSSGYGMLYLRMPSIAWEDYSLSNSTIECSITVNEDGTDRSVLGTVEVRKGHDISDVADLLCGMFDNIGVTGRVLFKTRFGGSNGKSVVYSAAVALSSKYPITVNMFGYSANVAVQNPLSLKHSTHYGQPVHPSMVPLDTLVNQRSISDDYFSHNVIVPSLMYGYNLRMVYANMKRKYFHPSWSGVIGDANYIGSSNDDVQWIFWFLKIDGRDVVVRTLPRVSCQFCYLYYPDTRCYKVVIYSRTSRRGAIRRSEIPMRESEYLNGSLFVCDEILKRKYDIQYPGELGGIPVEDSVLHGGSIERYSKYVFTDNILNVPELDFVDYGYEDLPRLTINSEVGNPFHNTAAGNMSVSNGRIIGISTATKALSQGQFGQFPVYLFTEDGTYAVSISDEGYFLPPKVVTRDVCINQESILQMDDSVLFATRRGIMELQGQQSVSITSSVLDGKPVDADNILPLFEDVARLVDVGDTLSPVEFMIFLEDCRMVRDYIHQRVVVFNPRYSYCYVYSNKSKTWSIQACDYAIRINSFPEAYVMTRSGKVKDLSQDGPVSDAETMDSIMVTRPIKLDVPNGLKTVNRILQRGMFRQGHVSQVLWGSRDMFRWFPIGSSSDGNLRYLCGTPYKYFRLAIVCHLQKDESLYGCTVEYTPKYGNQPR